MIINYGALLTGAALTLRSTDGALLTASPPNANWSCAQSSARRIIYLILIGCRRGALGRIVHELQVDVNTPAVIVIRDVFRTMLSVHFR